MSDLMRDPKSGRMFSRLETEVKQAAMAAEGFGLPKESQQLLALDKRVSDESPAVQTYVQQLVELVRNFNGPIVELKKVLPLLQEVNDFAAKDKTLTDPEKRRILGVTKELSNLINKKTSIFTRTTRSLRRVARKGASKLRDSAVDYGQNSDSGLLRLGARVLSRRENGEESEQKNILQTRADVLKSMLERKQQEKTKTPKVRSVKSGSGRPMSPKEFQNEPEFEKPPSPKKRKEKEDKDDQSALLTHILDTERDVLTELKALTKTLRGQTEDLHQERDEQARRDERQLESLTKLSPKQVKTNPTPDQKQEKGGIFGTLVKMLGLGELGLMVEKFIGGLGSAGGLILKTLVPALTTLASGAAVIGAAFAGWKVGSWIAKMVGLGDSADALKILLDNSQQSYSDSLKSAGKGVVEGLKRMTGIGETEEQKAVKDAKTLGRSPKATETPKAKTPLDANALPTASTSTPGAPSKTPTKQPYVMQPGLPTGTTSPTKTSVSNISAEGMEFIRNKETFSAKPYPDETGLAIGYGSHMYKGRSVDELVKENPNFRITKSEAEAEFQSRLKSEFVPAVRRVLKRPVSQPEFDALVSIAYNRGTPSFAKDKSFLNKVNTGTATADDFRAAHGKLKDKIRQGVEGRRGEEFTLYSGMSSPQPRKASVTNRSAGPIATMSANQNKGTTVIAPTTNVMAQKGDGGSRTVVVPVPVRPKNAESTFRAVQTINEV